MKEVMKIRNEVLLQRLRYFFLCFLCLGFGIYIGMNEANATPQKRYSFEFQVPKGLEGRVEFWRLMFTKYGKDQRVFHCRKHPEIIYSVLDFSEYERSLSGQALRAKKEQEVEEEIRRIRVALGHLGTGAKANNPFEKRIEVLFARVSGGAQKYIDASREDQIRYQSGIKERFREGLIRSGRYLYAIESIFRSQNLPVELGRLPLVESSFDYEAYSSVGAAGIWQFMRKTGAKYMKVGSAIDERRDPIISTRAAADYLSHSYEKLQSWALAVTSYNHGLNGVMKAAKEAGSRDLVTIIHKYEGDSFGFASENFYAEFLAALEVEQNAERYFPGIRRDPPLYFDEIKISRSTYFRDLVKMSDSDREELYWLNLGFRETVLRNQVAVPAGSLVKVPKGRGAAILADLAGSNMVALAGTQSTFGDKYSDGSMSQFTWKPDMEIAKTKAEIKNLKTQKASGQKQFAYVIDKHNTASRRDSKTKEYVVQKGDTLASIARANSVSTESIVIANDVADAKLLKPGKKLLIPESKRDKADAAEDLQITYVVNKGDTLASIAKKHDMKVSELSKVSGISNPKKLKPGMKINISNK